MTTQLSNPGYNSLREDVLRLLQKGRTEAEIALIEETARTYHGIGKTLDQYLLASKSRAGYGEQTVVRLAQDVGLSKSAIYQALAFFRLNPTFHTRGNLTWSHYRTLLSLSSPEAHQAYEDAAVENGWSVRDLAAQIKSGALDPPETEIPPSRIPKVLSPDMNLPALRGRIYTYRLLQAFEDSGPEGLRLDLGFGIHLAWPIESPEERRVGQIYAASEDGSGSFHFEEAGGRSSTFYSYAAKLVDVIDGDTVWLDIDCGFRVWTRQKVRLRGIDTPELNTAEGRRSKDFAMRALKNSPFAAVTTTKPDKYDRYLGDIFYSTDATSAEAVLREGKFLNRELLIADLAVRYR